LPASSTSTLSLAGRLRDLGDDDLETLLTAREIRDVRVRDYFDLAEALLDPASVQKALAGLDRIALAALASVPATGATTASLVKALSPLTKSADVVEVGLSTAYLLGLVDRAGEKWLSYRPVAEQFETWKSIGLPGVSELVTDAAPAGLTPVPDAEPAAIDHAAAEHAFNATNAVTALLAQLQREPARELARGGVALPDAKRLATAMAADLDGVAPRIAIAARAGLVTLDSGLWLPTDGSVDWISRSNTERWARLAGAWFARLPDDIRQLLETRSRAEWGDRLAEYIRWFYPAGGDWMRDRVLAFSREAEILGITANSSPSSAGAELLTDGEASAARLMAKLFPAEVDTVYLQHDLTIVAPGPLLPRLDARLRRIADVESLALATTYRVSESTVNRALAMGETAGSIREFLTDISLTGLPQPLDYLIVGAAARFGSLRVGEITQVSAADPQGSRSYIRVTDATLLSAIMVDRGLVALGLTRTGPLRAASRFEQSVVFWSLIEARYPVVAEDASGTIILLDRGRTARVGAVASENPAQAIVRRLRLITEPAAGETGKAWLERQLDTAIRAKMAVTVTVAMPDGTSVELQLEPASVAGGRLRARDRRSDLERTLPLSSITGISAVE
jgi:hypothetical protein